jgi:transcriptional regulator with XRE-family HTH domain
MDSRYGAAQALDMTRPRSPIEVVPGLGAHLRQLRAHRQLTQEELGARAGVKAATISRVESGVSTPDLDTLSRLAQALGVSLREALPGGAEVSGEAAGAAIAGDWARLTEQDRALVGALITRLIRAEAG